MRTRRRFATAWMLGFIVAAKTVLLLAADWPLVVLAAYLLAGVAVTQTQRLFGVWPWTRLTPLSEHEH